MAKGKTLSPQEIYRERKQREEQAKLAFLPPGLFNHGNTCFMNSVLQGLIATRLLSELVHFAPIPPSTQAHSATLLASRRSPQLTNGHDLAGEYEKRWVNTMPIGDMFLNVLHRSWEAQYARKRDTNLSPKPLLTALGKKYDQYLDFAQQDAHEFLRILLDAMSMEELDAIKKANPPQPPKKRRRTSSPPPPPPSEDAPIALADMIFGGKLASILVCQKCKHVSNTYEDFNDLSLSIKHEDYDRGLKKRDRFKSLAKRLGTVVSLGTSDPSLYQFRASSVPPSPRERPDESSELFVEAATAAEDPRRRSLDIPAEEAGAAQEKDHPVRLNGVSLTVTPDEKHIEFMDQPKVDRVEKKEKDRSKKDDDGWAKLGRRLSLGLATKSSKDKERKGRSAERASRVLSYTGLAVPSPSTSETPRASTSTVEQNPEIRLSRASRSLERAGATTTSTSLVPGPSSVPASLNNVARSKSPKPPKPSAGETAYLRQILADVTTGEGGAAAVWLKLGGGLPGVEECLRMFTSVEVLDGENMVGCRRCWKIAHGEYVPRAATEDYANGNGDADGDSEDSGDNKEGTTSPAVSISVETPSHSHGPSHHRPPLPTSLSTPLISVYSMPNLMKTAESSSSLPLVTPQSSSSDSALERFGSSEDTDTVTPPSSASSLQSLPLSGSGPVQEVQTPPATKVTVIPPTPSENTSFDVDGNRRVSAGSELNAIGEAEETTPSTPPLNGHGVGHSNGVVPDVNALYPPRPHHQRHLSDESSDGSSGDESDVSVASAQASSAPVSEDGPSDVESGLPAKPRTKPKSKPKPVIMRPAYKRYLIAVPPPVLVIHLKRFQQVSKTMQLMSFSNGFRKLDDYVTFPETLDLTPFLAPKKEDYGLKKGAARFNKAKRPVAERCLYRLYAVVVHIGNMLGGHYISYVALPTPADVANIPQSPVSPFPISPTSPAPDTPAAPPARQWAYISDTVVRLTTLEEVLKAKAYICMYERL
ncbi:hypothetical protein B0H16DRAFT_1345264 [Mycena metata]|uniref:Ubiquitin carboxyl-terminal hydrolase n=1 Tax=Mycena metata TaxID=1033252 RepID=A0AAD7MA79_9AGAR|nr:hypothetical protein B0H16DRAFT_1345264 [Mycena metata]